MTVYETRKDQGGNFYAAKAKNSFTTDACRDFLRRSAVLKPKNTAEKSLDCSRKTFDALHVVSVVRHTAVTTT